MPVSLMPRSDSSLATPDQPILSILSRAMVMSIILSALPQTSARPCSSFRLLILMATGRLSCEKAFVYMLRSSASLMREVEPTTSASHCQNSR